MGGDTAANTTTYVLDTSVLLSDPTALGRFQEHALVLPLAVLTELEAKRHHAELGWAARQSLRALEELRVRYGSLTAPVPANEYGGTLRVELNHQAQSALPDGLRGESNDVRILSVAKNLQAAGDRVVVVTKDLPLRLLASVAGVEADEYRSLLAPEEPWSGFVSLPVDAAAIDALFADRVVDLVDARDLPCHTGVALTCGRQSALGRVHPDKRVHLVDGERSLFDVRGRSAEQRVALDLLADPSVGIVSLGGKAGTGKSVLALAAGLDAVLHHRTHRRVMVFRPLYAVGGQNLGFLPGSESEKMDPWGAAVTDALESFAGREVLDEVFARGLVEVLPLTHIRGRSLTGTFTIIDEAQNLERGVLLTALSRLGTDSRAVLTHDVAQRDNLRVGRHDGIAAVVEALRGHPLFAHVTLTRSERSPVAALVSRVLDGEG